MCAGIGVMLDSYSSVALLRAVRVSTEEKLRREMISRVGRLSCTLHWVLMLRGIWCPLVDVPSMMLLVISMFRQRRAWLGVSSSVKEYVVRGCGCGMCRICLCTLGFLCVFTVAGLLQYITSHRKLI